MLTNDDRIAALEAIESIKSLKHGYWRACDAKDPEGFADSFIAEGAVIDYGPLGQFDDAKPLVDLFREVACRTVDGRHPILDMHHGTHPVIELTAHDTAVGRWSLRYRQVDTVKRTETVTIGEYDDEYRFSDGAWRISESRFVTRWSITRPLSDDTVVEEGIFDSRG